MLGKLSNWLLFMTLKLRFPSPRNRPLGLGYRQFLEGFSLPQGFPQDTAFSSRSRKLHCLQYLLGLFYGKPCRRGAYSSELTPPSAIDSNLVQCLRNAIRTRPMGPLRCLAIMISARPCNSGSSCL